MWQHIDTAPKDGTRFLAWHVDGTEAVKCYWYTHRSVSGWKTDEMDCNEYDFIPTRWMPLPAPPTT